ncbi:MAG: MATE efflux family [Lasallia pustulata]|uniref:MATE efflux family n=1 Tax=Lasallia pustulata TaxID=136370 RepID=A0A5M8PFR3_9LECA|nr:MAG: MATE efflux family [Lasallia pustulata]
MSSPDPPRDLEAESGDDLEGNSPDERDSDSDSEVSTLRFDNARRSSLNYSMVGSYRRPSFTTAGSRATVVFGQGADRTPTKKEIQEAVREERSLLRDNNVIPPKHPQTGERSESVARRLNKHLPVVGVPGGDRKVVGPGEAPADGTIIGDPLEASETTALLGDPNLPYGGQDSPENINKRWEEAVAAGKIQTTWQREAKVLGRYSAPLIATFLLQYSLTMASIFTVGHLGKVELGAVSLATMTANITGYAIYHGLATSLDTLCSQAYGSGKKKLVGLQMQRMVYFLWTITIPIGIIWLSAEAILEKIVPEHDVAVLAGQYLRIILIGAPGYACFESGKRYLQAQGLFSASLYVLLICAPLNALMNWLFVWQFGWGFIGAPIAVAVVDTLLPILLALYVCFIAGRSCWPGFTRRALQNWGPMIRLALPGLLMVEAECLAFELLTLASSYFGTTYLAAQATLATLTCLTFQIPFPISVAASTRIANLIGATLAGAAKTSAKVAMVAATIVGIFNIVMLSSLRKYIPRLFTSDPEVIELVAQVLPLCAAFQLFDALAANSNGILRGLGRQEFGGWVQLFSYYVVAMPISMGTAFGLGWKLHGLWSGVAVALGLVSVIEAVFLYRTSWERSVEDAENRNANS